MGFSQLANAIELGLAQEPALHLDRAHACDLWRIPRNESSGKCPNSSKRCVIRTFYSPCLPKVSFVITGFQAAGPGCIKMFRILSSACIRPVLLARANGCLGRAFVHA